MEVILVVVSHSNSSSNSGSSSCNSSNSNKSSSNRCSGCGGGGKVINKWTPDNNKVLTIPLLTLCHPASSGERHWKKMEYLIDASWFSM